MITHRSATALAAATLLLAGLLQAQIEPPSTGGAVAAEHASRMLGHTKRVLVIGAHPDDEDTELITLLVRGEGAEAAYLSLNRGEGGQNLIGSELGEALGVLRTQELLSARTLDGGRQFFTRAYDFGYSKTLEDTWAQWPRDSILKDVVRVIRTFQPQVIVSVFTGTPADGHGQHQAAGWAAREAFAAAGDPARFPELQREEGLAPWRPLKFYRSARFTPAPTMLVLQTGMLDPAVGQSYHQIAMASRSRHRSQEMGVLQTPGPASTRVTLVEDRTASGTDALFAGIDTTLPAAFVDGPSLSARLASVDSALAAARATGARRPEWDDQRRFLGDALANADGLVLDAVANSADVIAGQQVEVIISLWNAGRAPVQAQLGLTGLPGVPASRVTVPAGEMVSVTDTVRIPATATTEPYFLRLPRDGALYRWGNAPEAGLPASPPLLTATARIQDGALLEREVTYRWRDPAYGERRDRLIVAPRVGVRLDRRVLVWPLHSTEPRAVTVTLTHGAADTTSGEVRLELPPGWPVPPGQPFQLTRKGGESSLTFSVTPPANARPGEYDVRAVAVTAGGERFDESLQVVAYPHITRSALSHPAVATIRVMDIAVPSLHAVGYVRGAADGVPEALAGLGVPVVELTPDSLARGDLSRFDAIVIGSRAYETVPAVLEFNARLLAYAGAGGLLVVQYQQYEFFRGNYAPFPMQVGGQPLSALLNRAPSAIAAQNEQRPNSHDRVADERAPVRIVDPASPVVRAPNTIGPADWQGWVQERGLYFARAWAPEYHSVLEMHDPGEPPLEGSLLVAPLGRGTYVYTGLAFYRELPAGVPGAFRLFMNLLALRPAVGTP
jgi:LmbE family N-acetylglucosaminyl deacetylase